MRLKKPKLLEKGHNYYQDLKWKWNYECCWWRHCTVKMNMTEYVKSNQ